MSPTISFKGCPGRGLPGFLFWGPVLAHSWVVMWGRGKRNGGGGLPKNTFKPPTAPPSPKKCPKRILRSNLSLTESVWLRWCLRFGPSPWPSPLCCPPSEKELLSTIPKASAQFLLEIQTDFYCTFHTQACPGVLTGVAGKCQPPPEPA